MADSAIDQQEIDEEKAAQIRHLLAEENEEAVAHRFGEQELNSPEFQQAQRKLTQRDSARTERFKAEIEKQEQIDREREAEFERQKESERLAKEQAGQEPRRDQEEAEAGRERAQSRPDQDTQQSVAEPKSDRNVERDARQENQHRERAENEHRQEPVAVDADTADHGDSPDRRRPQSESTYDRVCRAQRESREQSAHGINR